MKKILIIQADYYQHISKLLLSGAIKTLTENNHDYEIISVPGALEIPCAISIAETSEKYLGYVALGCVIRGKTSHYEIVSNESARGLNDLSITKKLAIGNGILTVENEEQAIERADPKKLNKGGFAVETCLKMASLKQRFQKQ